METLHDQLFLQYAKELNKAKLAAETWWKELIASEAAKIGGRKEALANVKMRWPLGPASHPYVVAVIRKYWLACEELNKEISESYEKGNSSDEELVSPIVFLCDFLMDGKHEKLAAFIAPLNYWPIGMEVDKRSK
jgi:hypothetical protein